MRDYCPVQQMFSYSTALFGSSEKRAIYYTVRTIYKTLPGTNRSKQSYECTDSAYI